MEKQPDEPEDFTNEPLPSMEVEDAVASTLATPFAQPLMAASKSKAQKQREYRQRIAASRTPAQAAAARKAKNERQRKNRLRQAANMAIGSGALEATTTSSSRSGEESNNVQNRNQRQHAQQQSITTADQPEERVDHTNEPLFAAIPVPMEVQEAVASASATHFVQPTTAAPKTRAQIQREYRQRIAASRTAAQAAAARRARNVRDRNYRLCQAANLAIVFKKIVKDDVIMGKSSMCRICLIKDVRMHCLVNTDLQEIYELLTGKLLETRDRRPVVACYVCCARLRNCLQLRSACLHSEELFSHLLDNHHRGVKTTQVMGRLRKVSLIPVSLGVKVHREPLPKPEPSPTTGDQLNEEHVGGLEGNIGDKRMCTQLIQQQHIKCEDVTLEDEDSIPNVEDQGMCTQLIQQEHIKCEDVTSEDDDNFPNVEDQGMSNLLLKQEDIKSENVISGDDELDYSRQSVGEQFDLAPDNCCVEVDPLDGDISEPGRSLSSVKLEDTCTRTVEVALHRVDCDSFQKGATVTERLTSDDLGDTSTSTGLNNQQHQLMLKSNTLKEYKKMEQMSSEAHCGLESDAFNDIRTHTGDKQYKCGICGKGFSQFRYIKVHIRTHTGERPYKCDICGKSFARKTILVGHNRTHTGEKPFKCDTCGKRFSLKSTLVTHNHLHTGEKPHKCDICGKSFARKTILVVHNRLHTGEKPYKCDTCGKRFILKSTLVAHNRLHTGEKPYKCDICGKAFNISGSLIVHNRVHIGEKAFKCDICGKSFSVKTTLDNHIRTHTGEKPFKCDTCGKSFGVKTTLVTHIRTHTGEKPFKCGTCGIGFNRKSRFSRHISHHT